MSCPKLSDLLEKIGTGPVSPQGLPLSDKAWSAFLAQVKTSL